MLLNLKGMGVRREQGKLNREMRLSVREHLRKGEKREEQEMGMDGLKSYRLLALLLLKSLDKAHRE